MIWRNSLKLSNFDCLGLCLGDTKKLRAMRVVLVSRDLHSINFLLKNKFNSAIDIRFQFKEKHGTSKPPNALCFKLDSFGISSGIS